MSNFVNNDVSSGATIFASDHNTQGATIAAVLNGGIDNNNISPTAAIATSKLADDAGIATAKLADAAVTPAKLLAGTGASWVWSTWTPTVTAGTGAFTSASGAGRYTQIGKTVIYQGSMTITTIGTGTGCQFTLPVTAQSSGSMILGSAREDATSGNMGIVRLSSSTVATVARYDNGNIASGGSGSIVRVWGSYEAA